MKKPIFLLILMIFAISCEKDDKNYLPTEISKTGDLQLLLQEVQPNLPPGEVIELAPSFIKLENYNHGVLKNSGAESYLDPVEIIKSIKDGEYFVEEKTAHIEPVPPKGDILFMFDRSSSMAYTINTAKTNSQNIMNAIRAVIPDSEFGVISHTDYPGDFSGCGYSDKYGYPGDWAYSLDQSFTGSTDNVASVIDGLYLGVGGEDFPESYTRALYETYADHAIGWRENSKKIVIAFADNRPHDCAFGTGPDPGRDGIAGNADDLSFFDVIDEMKQQNITLIVINCGAAGDFWGEYAPETGGNVYGLGTDIVETIETLIEDEVNQLDNLTLEVCTPGYENWVTSINPQEYTNIDLRDEDNFDFTLVFHAPPGTPYGVYDFEVCAIADGVTYASQSVSITVYMEVPFDVHPGSCPNPLNRDSKGWTPMALLGTPEFDISEIDPATIRIGGIPPMKWSRDDVGTPFEPYVDKPLYIYSCNTLGPDGIMDMGLKFKTQELASLYSNNLVDEVLVITLTGELMDGTEFIGEDIVKIAK